MRFGLAAWSSETEDWHWQMSPFIKCLVRGWVFLKCGNFVNSCRAQRRFVSSSRLGLMRIFQIPCCSCFELRSVMRVGSDTSLHSICVISKGLLVAGCCQRHLILSSIVNKINKGVQDIENRYLVISPEVLVHKIQKINQALVFPST